MKKQNNIFDDIKLNIVDETYDYKERINKKIGQYYCTHCHIVTQIDGLVNQNSKFPDTIECEHCHNLMVHEAVIASYDIILSGLDTINGNAMEQLNFAKLTSSVLLRYVDFARKAKLHKETYFDIIYKFEIVLHLAALFIEEDTFKRIEKIIKENYDILKDLEPELEKYRQRIFAFSLIYNYLQYGIEYKQVDLVKQLLSEELKWKEQYPQLIIPIFPENPIDEICSYQVLFYKWGRVGLLHRENRKNRVYITKIASGDETANYD